MNYRRNKKNNASQGTETKETKTKQSTNYAKNDPNGSIGYSEQSLKALEAGNYQGRQSKYKTSNEQVQAVKTLPALEGMISTSNNGAWESRLSRNKYNAGIDPARARERYAQGLQQDEQKTSRDENYVVKRDRYDKLMKDSRLANDIKTLAELNYKNANQDATVSQEWADEYGAKKITGGYSKSQFIDTLSRRYSLTPKELNDMALTFHSDANNADVEQYGKDLEKLGKDHSVLGSVGSFVGTLGSGIEGMYNNAVGAISGDDRYLSNMFRTTKNSLREGVKQNIDSDLGKGAYDIAMGVGDMIAGSAAGSAPVILAGNTANEAQRSAMERGSGVRRSSAYGTASGILDYVTNKIGLDKAKEKALSNIKSAGIKKFLKQNAIAGLGEAGENVLQDIGQSFFDVLLNGNNAELIKSYDNKKAQGMSDSEAFNGVFKEYLGQLGISGATGFGMGSVMQAGKSVAPNIPGLIEMGLGKRGASKNADIQNILNGEVPKVTGEADIARAQAQQAQAVDNINRLSEQIPDNGEIERATRANEYLETYTPEGDISSMDLPHQIAERMAAAAEHFDTYDYMDDIQGMDGFIEQMADDISMGRDLTGYIDSLYENIDETDDPAIRAEMQGLIDDLEKIDRSRNLGIDNPENAGIIDGTNSERSAGYGTEENIVDGRTDTGSTGREEFESGRQEVSGSVDGQRTYTREDGRTFNLRNVVDENTSRLMDDAGLNNFDLRDTSNNREGFSRQLAEAKAANPNGRMVSNQDIDDLTDARIFTDPTGTTGVAIKPDGDIVGVHKHPSNTMGKAVDDLLITARANGGDRLDCYGAGLVNKYERDGFIPVAQVEWNEKFKPEDWGDNPPETVYVMMKDNRTTEQVLNDYKNGTFNYSTPEDLANLKMFSVAEYGDDAYDAALKYRDELLDGQPTSEGAFSNAVPEVTNKVMNESARRNPSITTVPEMNRSRSNGPEGPSEPPTGDGFVDDDMSRVLTNSAINAGIISKQMLDTDPKLQQIARYEKHSNKEIFNKALENVKTNGDKIIKEYRDGRVVKDDQDVDEGMLILTNIANQLEAATDEADIAKLTATRNLMLSKLRKAGTEGGQLIQAFAKWNKTADGAMLNAERINQERVNKAMSRNKKQKDFNNRIAKALEEMGKDASMRNAPEKAPQSREQVIEGIRNVLDREFGSVEELFNDDDIEFLADLAMNKKIPIWQITDEIEHKLNHGEWYEITEDTPVIREQSKRLQNLLDKAIGGKELNKPAKLPDDFSTTVEKVRATFEDGEYAGFEDLFGEDDYRFIATMFHEKVPNWQIEDELRHKMETGEWYTLDESTPVKKPTSQKLQNALNELVEREPEPEKEPLTFEQIKEQVKNTVENEAASAGLSRLYTSDGEFTDEDITYLANLIQNGATKAELAEALNTKFITGTFGISAPTQQKVNDLFKYANYEGVNSKKGVEAMMAAYKLLADETVGDATPFEKFETWRYLAMLGNTKTMVRNAVGNIMFNAVTDVSNGLSGFIEQNIDTALKKRGKAGIQRQKAVLNPTKDMGLIKAANTDAELNRWSEISGTKYEKGTKDAIKAQKSVFNSKLLQLYERATDAGISDTKFVKAKYATSLAGFMKANGLDTKAFDADAKYQNLKKTAQTKLLTDAEKAEMERLKDTVDLLEKGRDYAIKQAEYATFHEDNAVADWITQSIQKARNSDSAILRGLGTIGEGIMPFKKTPANILKSGFEYSPLGAIKSIAETGKLIYENTGRRKGNLEDTYTKRNKFTGKEKEVNKSLASDVIESWSKTLTGSALAVLGYYLANKGILRSTGKGDKYQNDLEGKQEYSIEINGKTYTVDWAAPAVMPMLLGAEAQRIAQDNLVLDEAWYKNIDKVVGTTNALLDPILETSFMQGVQNALESAANQVRYNNPDEGASSALGGIGGAIASNALTSYITQGLPTVSGQIARTVDNTRRATDTTLNNSFLAEFEKTGRKMANKIPFLSKYVNNPYYDAYGREQENSPFDNPLANFAYQTLSPAYVSDVKETPADVSARGAYNGLVPTLDANGNTVMKPLRDSKAFATWKNKVSINGEYLNPDQMAEYRQTTGQANYEIREALAGEDWFNNLGPAEQTEVLKSVNSLVDKVGKAPYTEVTGKEYEAYTTGGIPALMDFYRDKKAKQQIEAQTGLKATTNASKAIVEQVQQGNTEAAEQMIQEAQQFSDLGFTKPGPTYTYYTAKEIDPNISLDDFAYVYKNIDGADGSTPNEGLTKKEILAYLNSTDYTEDEGMQIWKMFKPSNAKKVPSLIDGVWK